LLFIPCLIASFDIKKWHCVKLVGSSVKATGEQILFMLKTRGSSRTGEIASRLGLTRQGARQQLEKLAAEGLIGFADKRDGVGRPRRSWSLTAKTDARFPDTHSALTLELLGAVAAEFGEAGLDRLIARRERDSLDSYRAAMGGLTDLRSRLRRLAGLRRAEGYMAEVSEDEEGLLLIENHCPICAAASACQGLCRSELAIFQAVLGEGCRVERIDHILAGARRCAYRVTQATV
jgi:predicted ArsR family transcriptional regulator